MMRRIVRVTVALAIAFGTWMGTASADVEVQVVLRGGLDEVMAVLAKLRDLGFGLREEVHNEDAIQVRVYSVPPTTTPEPEPPAEPDLALLDLRAKPASVKQGEAVTVSVRVADTKRVVDTIGLEARVAGERAPAFSYHVDLYDNGSHGDEQPADGIWTRSFALPDEAPKAAYTLTVTAYDAYGEPVSAPAENGGEPVPLEATAQFNLTD